MANTLITPLIVANESLDILQNNLVFANLVHRDFSNEFASKGESIKVRKPSTFTATNHDGSTASISNITEGSVTIDMDKLLYVDVKLSAKERTLDIADFSAQVLKPAVAALAQGIDGYLAELYKDIPYSQAVSSTAAVSDVAGAMKILNTNKAPVRERVGVLSPKSHAAFSVIDSFLEADKKGAADAMRENALGRVMGADWYMDQNIVTNTSTQAGAFAYITIPAATDSTSHVNAVVASMGSGAIVAGNNFTVAGSTKQFVFTEALAAGPAAAAIGVNGAGTATVAGVFTIATGGDQNLVFNKNAFALVTRPIAAPMGANSSTANYDGLSITAVMSYDNAAKADVISLQVLCGVKTLNPELAVRLIDRS